LPDNRNGLTARERVLSRLAIDPSGHLLWSGSRDKFGYGRVMAASWNGIKVPQGVHRVAYEMLAGPIPEGLTLDHLCGVKHCAAPAHLEPVTQAENSRRGRMAQLAAQGRS
jgi:hypothetical protein